MDIDAVNQAQARLARAEKALYNLKTAANYDEAEAAWSDYLTAASTIYSKLEQGSKSDTTGKSAPWFGRMKHERKHDPLLRFLHQARNSDEHGIERVAARGGNAHDLYGLPLVFNEYREHIIEAIKDGTTGDIKAQNVKAILHGPSLQMIRVYDRRHSTFCDPPLMHLNKVIEVEDNSLIGVAALGMAYFTIMLAEAQKFVNGELGHLRT